MDNKNAILFGNGLNLLSEKSISWNDLLKRLSSLDEMPSDSNTLNYECIYLNVCPSKDVCESERGAVNEYDLKSKIAAECDSFVSNEYYNKLIDLPVDTYLTTNYDCVLDRTLLDSGYEKDNDNTRVTESIYSIRRCHAYHAIKLGKIKRIFPIHGVVRAPKTIMIGYDHYCGSLGKLDDYFKGKYVYKYEDNNVKLPRLLDRLEGKNNEIPMSSLGLYWPDYFFTHNIHIIGLGMPLVESDLWWVLNKRSRYQKIRNNINNAIYFYGDPDPSITNLLKSFGVRIERYPVENIKDPKSWKKAYDKMFERLAQLL